MSDQQQSHLHLARYGYERCSDPGCTRPQADPEDDALCSDPDCEGGCPAAAYNAWRRREL